jgi:hypothetical protein
MKNYFQFLNFYDKLKKYFEQEQKELLFNKRSKKEEAEYFNFFKFIFESPDPKADFSS